MKYLQPGPVMNLMSVERPQCVGYLLCHFCHFMLAVVLI